MLMTGQASKKWIFIAICTLFIILGLGAFAISDVLSHNGWEHLLGWFSSQDAILLYIFLGCYILTIALVMVWDWSKKL